MKKVIVICCNETMEEISEICANIVNSHESILPISPDIVFHYLDSKDPEEADKKLHLSFNLIGNADEVWVFGNCEGNDYYGKQIKMARLLSKNIRFWGKD